MKHSFSNVPQADIPRSNFNRSFGHKSTFNAGDLVPVFVDEALPGDTFNIKPSLFARMSTPIYPIMDNLFMDIHWFSVPCRLLWSSFRKFCGEQTDPGDSTDYTIPERSITASVSTGTFEDYIGLPVDQGPVLYNAMFLRAYQFIFDEWYRDQNLVDAQKHALTDAGGSSANGETLLKRGKRHDYFTSCLPWLQKGDAVSLPLGTEAPIFGDNIVFDDDNANDNYIQIRDAAGSGANLKGISGTTARIYGHSSADGTGEIKADLSAATAATINELRQAFQIQKLLERDARSGTRYSEVVKAHFGVDFMDVTYRPEYLGGGSTAINMHSVAATSESNANLGDLGAFGTALLDSGGFVKSFTEHSIVMGIVSVRADLTYQQGLHRMFSRQTRYDYYWPALAHIGEQSVKNKEIFHKGDVAGADDDNGVFGYQERWAEYRYKQSQITGQFRSNHASTLDAWHLSQEFGSLPTLNETFITETPPIGS